MYISHIYIYTYIYIHIYTYLHIYIFTYGVFMKVNLESKPIIWIFGIETWNPEAEMRKLESGEATISPLSSARDGCVLKTWRSNIMFNSYKCVCHFCRKGFGIFIYSHKLSIYIYIYTKYTKNINMQNIYKLYRIYEYIKCIKYTKYIKYTKWIS